MSAPAWLTARTDGVRVSVKVTPRAARTLVQGVEHTADGQAHLAVRVTAPPEAGKANDAVLALLAKRWRLPVRDLALVRGASARRKVVQVRGEPAALLARIAAPETPGGKDRD